MSDFCFDGGTYILHVVWLVNAFSDLPKGIYIQEVGHTHVLWDTTVVNSELILF